MKTLYFSATGNSLSVAKKIGGELLSIPQMVKEDRYEFTDDAIGIVFPVYSSRPPKMVENFLKKAVFHADYTFAVATFAALPGNPLCVTDKKFDYTAAVKEGDNFLDNIFVINLAKKISPYRIERNLGKVVSDIHNRVHHRRMITPLDHIQTAAFRFHHNLCVKGTRAQKDFYVTDACVKCGTCAKACPAGNITVDAEGVHFGGHCESCYACIHVCPYRAMHLKNENGTARWRHPDVTVQEIIDSNCRI